MKFLIIRFSSIGDIVFTTPVIRCLRKQFPDAEIHFLTKPENKQIVENNPYINKVILLKDSLLSTVAELRREHYTSIIDLHKNLRTFLIKSLLLKTSYTYNKLNWEKWMMIKFHRNILPANLHITERNLLAVKPMKVKNDHEGMDYFIAQKDEVNLSEYGIPKGDFIAWVIGAKHFTKILPIEQVKQTITQLQKRLPNKKIVLLGGKSDIDFGNEVASAFEKDVLNACGKFNLSQSTSILNQSELVLSGDTGLLHIAVALGKPVVSIWGSTLPEFGVFPLYGKSKQQPFSILEVKDLYCRPCSKHGLNHCPEGHFRCMKDISALQITKAVTDILSELGK